ncbi:MAG: hydroxyacid dehydrogenase [Hyphomicrobiales bacterium]|nr:hydroxyacid dehydrogenase [Hyphomicrobiales bacterium]
MADIVISEFIDEAALATLSARFPTHYDPGLVDRPGDLAEIIAGAKALIVRNRTRVDGALLDAAPGLQCIGRLGVGLDNIDLDECAARAIAVYPATGANNMSVAEYVVTAILILLRRAWFASADVAAGAWPRRELIGREAAGKVLGLVGFGAIARETAMRAAALRMDIIAFDPFLADDDPAWTHARRVTFDALLAEADAVSLHVPLSDQTRHLVNGAALARMKSDAVLINAARGGVVDETALVEALHEGRLAGAALDVFETEPLTADAGAAFAGLANIILTPHIAGLTAESNDRVGAMTAASVLRHLEG